ncbi:hypothetical protein FQR65_LT20678 [Abscondita terminalis]|nr:hypothetical protein FQR65_LT20678 [Abscondita terminalis]
MKDLASYASDPSRSRGRTHAEPAPENRTEFQRDRDRIVHSGAFRRLEYKTQVFVNHEGDLFRTRLTHSLEVAQIARTLARSLGVSEDLTEAISLAHDLGHTPFGHAGQDELNACMRELAPEAGGFEHNLQSLRVVDELEERYADFNGLNLCFETREGILKHCSAAHARQLGDVGRRFLERTQPSLEAQLANLADEIAYNNHDIDDGLRSGLASTVSSRVQDCGLFDRHHTEVLARYPDLPSRRARWPRPYDACINTLIVDLTRTSLARIADAAPASADDWRRRPCRSGATGSAVSATPVRRAHRQAVVVEVIAGVVHHAGAVAAVEALGRAVAVADQQVRTGYFLQHEGEVLAARERPASCRPRPCPSPPVSSDLPGAAKIRFGQGIDQHGIAALVVDGGAHLVARGLAVDQFGDAGVQQVAHVAVQRAHAELERGRLGITCCLAAIEGAHRDHDNVQRIDVARTIALQAMTMAGAPPPDRRAVRHCAVSPMAFQPRLDVVRDAMVAPSRSAGGLADGRACCAWRRSASQGYLRNSRLPYIALGAAQLLRGWKIRFRVPSNSPCCPGWMRRRQQHGRVAVVAAGVHDAFVAAAVSRPWASWMGSASMSARSQGLAARAAPQPADHAGAAQAAFDLIAPFGQALRHQVAGAEFFVAQFRMAMDVAAQRDEIHRRLRVHGLKNRMHVVVSPCVCEREGSGRVGQFHMAGYFAKAGGLVAKKNHTWINESQAARGTCWRWAEAGSFQPRRRTPAPDSKSALRPQHRCWKRTWGAAAGPHGQAYRADAAGS